MTKRILQLTGQRIPDAALPNIHNVKSLLAVLVAPPKPKQLAEVIRNKGELAPLPKVTVYKSATCGCCSQEWTENAGKQMCVLVRVEVREIDSGGLNLANLRRSFRGNFFSAYYARDCARRKALHAIAKLMTVGERGNFVGVEHGFAIKQDDMASDAKSRTLLC